MAHPDNEPAVSETRTIPTAILDRLVQLALEIADDLEAEVGERWHARDSQPSHKRKYERDIAAVRELRLLVRDCGLGVEK